MVVATTDAGVALSAVGADNGDMTLTVGDDYVANVTGIWDNNVTGDATIDAAGVSIDGTAASNVTVTGASTDLTLSSVGGSVNVAASEAAADAIKINASDAAGGIDIDAGTNGVDVDSTGSINLTSSQAAATAIVLNVSNAAGGIDIDAGTGTVDILQTGAVAGNGIALATTNAGISLSAVGAANGDLTLAAGDDLDVNVTGDATIDAAGVSIDGTAASNVTVTGASTDLTLSSVGGSVNVAASEAAADAVRINASDAAGGIDIDAGTSGVAVDTTGALSLDGTGTAANLTLTSNAAGDGTLVIAASNAGDGAGLIDVDADGAITVDSSAAGISLDGAAASNFTTSAGDLTLQSSAASVNIVGVEADAAAILLDANNNAAGGIDIDAGTSGVAVDTTGAFSIDGAGTASNISLASDGAADNLTVALTGATASSLILSSAGTGADAIQITTAAGGIDITAAGNGASEDLDLTATGVATEIRVTSASTEADAIRLNASAGGIDIDAANSTMAITNTANGEADDFTITQAGAQDASLILSSAGTAADALQITATAGGIDISASGAAAGEDIDIAATGSSVNVTSTEADAAAIKLNASDAAGGIDIDAGTGTINVLQTGTIAGNGVVVATTDAGVALSAVGADNGDMTLTVGDDYVANVTGIWDNNITGDATVDAASVSIDSTSASNFTVTADSDAKDLTIATTGTEGDLLLNTADDFALGVAAGAVVDIADSAVAKTIDIGGVTASGTDTVSIATEATAADVIAIGNDNAATTLAVTGGTAWSVSTTGVIATTGLANLNGGIAVDTDNFTVSGTTGATTVLSSGTTGNALDIGYDAIVQTGAMAGVDVDLSNVTTDGTNAAYGIHVNDQVGATASTEYGIYVEGTNWDYGLYVADDAHFNTKINLGMQTFACDASCTAAADAVTVTPTAAFINLTLGTGIAGDTDTTTIAAGTTGDVVILINNEAAETFTLADGAGMRTSAQAIGQYDAAMLIFDGTSWVQVSAGNN